MDKYTATEMAFKHGYEKGFEAGKKVATDNNVGGKWIPVTERLPANGDTVIVCDAREDYVNCFWYDMGWWYSEGYRVSLDEITHWMPLPEPPKEDE